MPQLISFHAANCFNQIADCLRFIRRCGPVTFRDYADVLRDTKFRDDEPNDEQWEVELQAFEEEMSRDAARLNRVFCEHSQVWEKAFGYAWRAKLALNSGDVHEFDTPEWPDLLHVWRDFSSFLDAGNLTSSIPPWKKGGECNLPLVATARCDEFESKLFDHAHCFFQARSVERVFFVPTPHVWGEEAGDGQQQRTSPILTQFQGNHHPEPYCRIEFDDGIDSWIRQLRSYRSPDDERRWIRCEVCGNRYLAYRIRDADLKFVYQRHGKRILSL